MSVNVVVTHCLKLSSCKGAVTVGRAVRTNHQLQNGVDKRLNFSHRISRTCRHNCQELIDDADVESIHASNSRTRKRIQRRNSIGAVITTNHTKCIGLIGSHLIHDCLNFAQRINAGGVVCRVSNHLHDESQILGSNAGQPNRSEPFNRQRRLRLSTNGHKENVGNDISRGLKLGICINFRHDELVKYFIQQNRLSGCVNACQPHCYVLTLGENEVIVTSAISTIQNRHVTRNDVLNLARCIRIRQTNHGKCRID